MSRACPSPCGGCWRWRSSSYPGSSPVRAWKKKKEKTRSPARSPAPPLPCSSFAHAPASSHPPPSTGMTLGIMGLDKVGLQIVATAGDTEKERRHAREFFCAGGESVSRWGGRAGLGRGVARPPGVRRGTPCADARPGWAGRPRAWLAVRPRKSGLRERGTGACAWACIIFSSPPPRAGRPRAPARLLAWETTPSTRPRPLRHPRLPTSQAPSSPSGRRATG